MDGRQEHLSTIEMKERMRSVSGDKLSSQGQHNGPHSSLVFRVQGGEGLAVLCMSLTHTLCIQNSVHRKFKKAMGGKK